MKRRQELAEEAERQRIKEEQEAKAASEAAEQAKREAERRDDVDVGASHDDSGMQYKLLRNIHRIVENNTEICNVECNIIMAFNIC